MVSTRGIRYKFSEGERVLCYEPDPTKAKVLYDSKVLEVIENKDKRGRRTVEYLIHFQGWNSSWDRCVSEDFVLKDTVENRHLQRDLAEKSQLQLGAYLYRRERKKGGGSTTGAGASKRSRHGFSDDGSSSSTQLDEGEVGDTDSSASGSGSQPHSPPASAQPGRAHINLPSALRSRLTFDYHLVVKRGWLSRVPATPCAAQILESFVKWFARAGAWQPTRARHDPPQRPDLLDVSCRLNLVREVADGMRVYFDFILRGHLLYKQEHSQYQEVCGRFLDADSQEEGKSETQSASAESQQASDPYLFSVTAEEDLKSPKIPEYAHLPPDPMDSERNGESVEANNREDTVKLEPRDKPAKQDVTWPSESQNHTSSGGKVKESRASRRTRNLARSVGSSGSSLSENWVLPAQAGASVPPTTRTPLSLLLDKVAKWQIIPREGTEHLPCRVYGAVHLARLFVKLPDFLNATQMPDFKLKLILKHIDMFVQYLDEHGEWFGEMYYIADNSSRSH